MIPLSTSIELPEPSKVKALDRIPFSVEASIVKRMGSESVSEQVLAVIELIKNAYDADAKEVRVILRNLRTGKSSVSIIDSGNGMTLDELKKGWLRIATSVKARKTYSPVLKRRVLGQKGIGRFAVENLSRHTILTTYPRNQTEGYIAKFDWNDFNEKVDLQSVQNDVSSFEKPKDVQGTQIDMTDLKQTWTEEDVKRLRTFIRSLTPPAITTPNFNVTVETDEFEDLSGKVESDFLERAVFRFEAKLSKTGRIDYKLWKHGEAAPVDEKDAKLDAFRCGPVTFTLYFYYREKNRLAAYNIDVEDIDDVKSILDDYGGIKVYRDGIRISGFGNPDDDWSGLDAESRNDPSVVPGRNQIIAMLDITSEFNPDINDTTTRENMIKNDSFKDMLKFLNDSIGVFAQMRGELELKRAPAPKPGNSYVKKARENLQANKSRKPMLDFVKDYPSVFYHNLEAEINLCYVSSLPNATMMLSRKIVENLLYNLFEEKFPKDMDLRFSTHEGRAHDFSLLIENLEIKIGEFNREQRDLIVKFLNFVKPFRRNANANTHKVIEYLDTINDLDKLKVPEMTQLLVTLIKKIEAEKGP
jgi:hypothetical protein